MALTNKDLTERAKDELSVLDGVIDYADRMISEEGKRGEYGPLRRHAYGKTVVIETEKEGVLTFRLSATSALYPNVASGYATPHSPVGRLCSFLRTGDEDESPRWGEYRVLEIRLFDRFDGMQFEPNVRNFLRMKVKTEHAKAQAANLRGFVAGKVEDEDNQASAALPPVELRLAAGVEQAIEPLPETVPTLAVDDFPVIEDEDDTDVPVLELDDDEPDAAVQAPINDDYYGLSETFYLDRTREQDQVMSRSPIGAMFVEGVAGSGKTSAALGRTKMLCDFNPANVSSEAEFREIAGQGLAYWSGKFANQFSQEGSVGFVRTGELIQYLKETCRRLDLPNLPVQEFPELRSRLRQHRRLERSKQKGARWAGLPEPRGSHEETSMAWLKCADHALAAHWAQALRQCLPTLEAITAGFDGEHRTRAKRVAEVALQYLRTELNIIADDLARPGNGPRFVLDRLAVRVDACIEQVRKLVLAKEVIWANLDNRAWIAANEREMADQLFAAKAPLFLRTPARLVFLTDQGPVDSSLAFLSKAGEVLPWSDALRVEMDNGEVLVRDGSGKKIVAKACSINDLYFRLLPEATEKLYVLREGTLRPLSLQRGLGKEKLNLLPTVLEKEPEEDNAEEPQLAPDGDEDNQKRRSVDLVFNTQARRALLQPLSYLADAYAQVLAERSADFPSPAVAEQIALQLQERKLADEDIDLLLCLAHIVGRSFKGLPTALAEPDFYQSVFIDEVQDFTEQQVFLMAEQAHPDFRAVTVVGDAAQKLHNGSRIDIKVCFPNQSLETVQLTENLRQLEAPGLAWFSACFRARLQDGLPGHVPSPALQARMSEYAGKLRGPELSFVLDEQNMVEQIVEALRSVHPRLTAAVVLPTTDLAKAIYARCKDALAAEMVDAELSQTIDLSRRHVRHFTCVTHAKGLEFDVVIVPYLEHYQLDDRSAVNQLYVALTRARRKLVLLSDVDRPASAFDNVWKSYEDYVAAV